MSSDTNLDGLPVFGCDRSVLYARKNLSFYPSVPMILEWALFILRQVDRVMLTADRFPNVLT